MKKIKPPVLTRGMGLKGTQKGYQGKMLRQMNKRIGVKSIVPRSTGRNSKGK